MRKYGYIYHPQNNIQDKNKRHPLRNLFFLFAALIFIYFLGSIIFRVAVNQQIGSIITPLAKPVASSISNFFHPSQLKHIVESNLAGTDGTYAVAIKNLKTGEAYFYNPDMSFESASLYKLWVMAVVFQKIQSGKLDQDKDLNDDIKELNDKFKIASEDAELTAGTFEMSVNDALNQMITISHNYSALALTQQIGILSIANFLMSQGFIESSVQNPPKTTASDIEGFFEKLYFGKLAGKTETDAMITLLKNQQINDRIPKYLPKNVVVADKTGELDGYKHDAGIVYSPHGDYVIVMLSKTPDSDAAAEREALLSKAVYQYFESK